MSDALYKQHNLINNQNKLRLSVLPNTIRCSNPPPYHQFLMNSGHSVAYVPDKYQVKHQRGHSAQEFSNSDCKEVIFLIHSFF